MIKFTKETFLNSDEVWSNRYAMGLCWCGSGLSGISSSGVNPYHQATPLEERNDKSRKVVYAIYNYSGKIDDNGEVEKLCCFFEDDYVKGFKKYKDFKEKIDIKLFVGFLKVDNSNENDPLKTWNDNEEYLNSSHANSLHWSDEKKAWFF